MASEITNTSRFLVPMKKIPLFILIMSPIIIIFLLFLAGGNGFNPLPGLGFVVSFCIVLVLLRLLRGSLPKREVGEIIKSIQSVCGIFDIGDVRTAPSIRLVFHWFTMAYLAIHIFAQSGLPESHILYPAIFLSVIVLLSFGDVLRLYNAKCFRGKTYDYFASLFVGGGLGAGLAFAAGVLVPNMVFFKHTDPLAKCVKDNDGNMKCNVKTPILQLIA
jgi:hypothetical protein